MEHIQTAKIQERDGVEIYTAHIQRNGSGWIGWIQEVPEVKCEAETKKSLIEILDNELHVVLEARADAWDKQIEEDIKAGRLEPLRKKALEELNMEHIQVFEIWDSEYETTYTAHIQKNGSGWIGWIQEHPKVRCEESTQEALLETLESTLYETLEADWEAWDKQIEEDAKTGKLDKLDGNVLEDLRAGRCKDL